MEDKVSLKQLLLAEARKTGFSACRIADPKAPEVQKEHLATFVEEGRHGQMNWLAERQNWRADPAALWPAAKSVIMLADTYYAGQDPLAALEQKQNGTISIYAQGRDYHDVVKKRLKNLGRWLIEQVPGSEIKVFVDTAPVMEKPLAQRAGLGWQGKHTNLVSRELGSWFFLGCLFTTIDFPKDEAEIDHCGSCQACMDICPTRAITGPYEIDATKCISYLTIEHKGPIDEDLRPLLGNRIYGCDDCLAICPWNKFAQQATEVRYHARPELSDFDLLKFTELDDASFRKVFTKSPIKRIGVKQFLRNVLYAIGNGGKGADQSVRLAWKASALRLANDEDATVKDAANWAIKQLEGEA